MITSQKIDVPIELADDVVLSVRNVSKKFCRNLRRSMAYGIKDLACNLAGFKQDTTAIRKHEFWALKDINLELRKSEFLGIIGANGSGKSTFLRLIHGIFPPDKGEIVMKGRVGALIALGAGFHPHFTGRENIYLNGAILGMNRAFIDSRLKRIVEFAEIGDFLEAPVSTYSSGMRVRLGFSVAAHMNPDILLVDEVLSVGDSSFRERCYNRMTEYKQNGGTVIFISHNTLAVEQVCERVIWLDHGRVRMEDAAKPVVEAYEHRMQEIASLTAENRTEGLPASSDLLGIEEVTIRNSRGENVSEVEYGHDFVVRMAFRAAGPVPEAYFGLAIRKGHDLSQRYCTSFGMMHDGLKLRDLPAEGVVSCRVKSPNLSPGVYSLDPYIQKVGSGKLGEKFWVRPTTRASVTILPGKLREALPGASGTHIVSSFPPAIIEHDWDLDGITRASLNTSKE